MDCTEARTHLLDRRRGRLEVEVARELEEHLAGCAACRHEDAADRQLSTLLEERLPRRRAPASLRRALEDRWGGPRPRRRVASVGRAVGAMIAGAAFTM